MKAAVNGIWTNELELTKKHVKDVYSAPVIMSSVLNQFYDEDGVPDSSDTLEMPGVVLFAIAHSGHQSCMVTIHIFELDLNLSKPVINVIGRNLVH